MYSSIKKIEHIEMLRGISILLVLLFHLKIPGFQNGFLGVDIFFVLSGFLMGKIYTDLSSCSTIVNFYHRRMARILPAYYVVIAVTLLICIFLTLNHELKMVYDHSLWAAFLASNYGYWLESSYFSHLFFRPILNLWSLGVEIQFYILFPLIVWLSRSSPGVLIFAVLSSLLTFVILDRSTFFLTISRLWEFMIGIYLAQSALSFGKYAKYIGLFSLIVLCLFLIVSPSLAVGKPRVFGTILTGVLTAAVINGGFSMCHHLGWLSKLLMKLGKYSYSIYLVHFPVIILINYQPFENAHFALNIKNTGLAILVTLGFAWLLHNYVENPLRKSLTFKQLLIVTFLFPVFLICLQKPIMHTSVLVQDPTVLRISYGVNDRDKQRCPFYTRLHSHSCVIGKEFSEASVKHLLVGDSHADGIKSALAKVLNENQHSLRLLEPTAAVGRDLNSAEFIINAATKHDIDNIILHSSAPPMTESLKRLLHLAKEKSIRVSFVDPVPIYDESVPKYLYTSYKNSGTIKEVGTSLAQYEEYHKHLFSLVNSLSEQYSNLRRFPVAQQFCDQFCLISDEQGSPYYFDDNHITLTGSERLAPVFLSIVESVR